MIRRYRIFLLLLLLVTINCKTKPEFQVSSLINTAHLDHLYEEITVDDEKMAIIHIYSNYPDYQWANAEGEGIACVDDVARAVILYLELYKMTNNSDYWKKVKSLINFLRYMQADNGWFYNFIEKNYSINKIHKNSTALPTWWTWRALWAMSEVSLFLAEGDSLDKTDLPACMAQSVQQLLRQQPDTTKLKTTAGFNLPTWLPYETGADQTAILILFLVNYYKLTGTPEVSAYIRKLCSGIIRMQQGNQQDFPHFAFLSWDNTWHSWGNTQSYALLHAYLISNDHYLLTKSLQEINYFYTYLYQHQYLAGFSLNKENDEINVLSRQQFSQIAYGFRPMVWTCLLAGIITGDDRYDKQAAQLAGWFFGDNPVKKQMYDPHTGRCFDGIENAEKINKNSGAESTIEVLLTLIRIEQNPTANQHLLRIKNAL